MRDGPKGRSPLRHAKPSWGGRKAQTKVDVQATPLPTIGIACPGIRRDGRMLLKKSLLQRGKSFDSLDYEGIGGFRHDGHPNGTGTVVL